MSKQLRVLTIGGATQDIYLHYQGADCMKIMESGGERSYMLFESGSKVEVEKILYATGGGATNSAVGLKRLGFDASCFCMVGDDVAGRAVLLDLDQEHVDTSKITISKEYATGTSFVINSLRKERTIFAYRGANSFLEEKNIPFDLIEKIDQLYITSLSNESAKLLQKIVKHAKKHNVPVAINPGKSQISIGAKDLKKSLKYVDILILNRSEAKTFMGAHENLCFTAIGFFKEVMKMGPTIVVMTDGVRGVYAAQGTKMFFHPASSVDVVDTLGAGDSFGSCFVGCLRKGLSIEDSLRYGVLNSASVIGHVGAKPGLLSFDELKKRADGLLEGLLEINELQ